MAMIKDALSSVPAKPALWIAPLLVVLVLSLYYRDQYLKCAEIRDTRARLTEHLQTLALPAEFRLADFTDFNWTRVRIVASVSADTISDSCPLDWNWASGERESLLSAAKLAAMVFAQQGRIVRYVELRGDRVRFEGAEGNLAPHEALFRVRRNGGDSGGFVLTLEK